MKKKYLLITFLLCTFAFNINVRATSFSCKQTEIIAGTDLVCSVSMDEGDNEIEVSSPLPIKNITGNGNENKGKKATFVTSGNIVFKTDELNGDYVIKALDAVDSQYSNSIKIHIGKSTTTKPTTTTTTTTKIKSDNNYLSSITINGKIIENFNKTKTKYFIDVENDVKKVNIYAEVEDENAITEVDGPKTLEVGDNEYTISVTSESNTTKFYKVIVTRKDEEESSITDIKNIKVKGYKLNFDKNSKTFYLNIKKEDTELDIDVITKDKNADYEIDGNENLEDGSVIKIVVTAENGITDTYRIIIKKETTNYLPIIIGGIILIILIIVIVIVAVKKNNKKDSNKKSKCSDDKNSNDKDADIDKEKTIEMAPVVNEDVIENNNLLEQSEDEIVHVDNDEEEETRILSYAEREELEKTKLLDEDEVASKIDEELEKTLLFDFDNKE